MRKAIKNTGSKYAENAYRIQQVAIKFKGLYCSTSKWNSAKIIQGFL